MRKILLLLCLSLFAFGDINHTIINNINEKTSNLDTATGASIWNVRYENFIKYQDINDELIILNSELKEVEDVHLQDELKRKIATLERQLNVLKEYEELNFAHSLSAPEDIETSSKLTNPFAIIGVFSHIKKLRGEKGEYAFKFNDFKNLVEKIREKNLELKELVNLEPGIENIETLKASDKRLEEFDQALKFASVPYSVYEKKIDDEVARVSAEIKAQGLRAVNIVIAIIIVVAIAFMLEPVAKKYIKDNERYYTATKVINFINLNIIFLILLFAYIENITYLVTILGSASTGLAIIMKDMLMSMLGWCVVVFGGSFRVGDHVKVFQNDTTYVGDIIDIPFLHITLYEDITLETYSKSRRAGRIVFVPNNYVFTNLISNYTHRGMKTILDGIDISVTFDSNIEKAQAIVEEIVNRLAKGYTKLAKKIMKRLQNEYSIRNPKVEPRFFVFFEHWGIRISVWYMTNSYAALILRSAINKEIVREFNKHEDIKVAYPSQNLYLGSLNQAPFETHYNSMHFHAKDNN